FMVTLSGCGLNKKEKGAIIGAGAGAVIGGVVGNQAGNTAVGAILGAVIGGAAGLYIGSVMDKQAAEIEQDIEGARVERIGEGLKITFESGILFDVDRAELRTIAKSEIGKLAVILNKYPDTDILIEGHTDSDASEEYNSALSVRRAESVAIYLSNQQVNATRFTVMGYGEIQPIADNSTAAGKQQNRRVEIAIYANDKLKAAAKKQAGEG
ncbi:MAG TPA: OmpA family protein, partial [candidate division Zixibacteria bacterium]|nr:OmpA family protein [candidate division Zixibacteria bacterium]